MLALVLALELALELAPAPVRRVIREGPSCPQEQGYQSHHRRPPRQNEMMALG